MTTGSEIFTRGLDHYPGGRTYGGTRKNTIDLIKDGNENGYLPSMPEYTHFPCVGIVDEDRILVIDSF